MDSKLEIKVEMNYKEAVYDNVLQHLAETLLKLQKEHDCICTLSINVKMD